MDPMYWWLWNDNITMFNPGFYCYSCDCCSPCIECCSSSSTLSTTTSAAAGTHDTGSLCCISCGDICGSSIPGCCECGSGGAGAGGGGGVATGAGESCCHGSCCASCGEEAMYLLIVVFVIIVVVGAVVSIAVGALYFSFIVQRHVKVLKKWSLAHEFVVHDKAVDEVPKSLVVPHSELLTSTFSSSSLSLSLNSEQRVSHGYDEHTTRDIELGTYRGGSSNHIGRNSYSHSSTFMDENNSNDNNNDNNNAVSPMSRVPLQVGYRPPSMPAKSSTTQYHRIVPSPLDDSDSWAAYEKTLLREQHRETRQQQQQQQQLGLSMVMTRDSLDGDDSSTTTTTTVSPFTNQQQHQQQQQRLSSAHEEYLASSKLSLKQKEYLRRSGLL